MPKIESNVKPNLTQMTVLTFGPVQAFLGGGQRLRDWAVGSWLCHYLTAALIYRWEQELGAQVLLPLTSDCEILNWLNSSNNYQEDANSFWRASLPNVITALHPSQENWQQTCQDIVKEEWMKLVENLETVVVHHSSYENLINGVGWKVIKRDCKYLWSVYSASLPIDSEAINFTATIAQLHQRLDAQKQGRAWQGTWWSGRTSPSDGRLSIWHPGLQPINAPQGKGRWGISYGELNRWWEQLPQQQQFSGMFSSTDRLNSLELFRRLSSFPEIIEGTLRRIWQKKPPTCPWGRFPDRTAAAATWVVDRVDPNYWSQKIDAWQKEFMPKNQTKASKENLWGVEKLDRNSNYYAHPRVLERRNVRDRLKLTKEDDEKLAQWRSKIPQFWDCTIEWTVGWRGDGDNIGDWLSGKQYEQLGSAQSQWHLTSEKLAQYQPQISNDFYRQLDLLPIFNLLVLFEFWNQLLVSLTEKCYYGKVIFSGGDDFLLLGSLADAIDLTSDLYRLWRGEVTDITEPTADSGWVVFQEKDEIYPVPGRLMTFSLGVVIAQRRIPQSLWHRGLEQAYKEAKKAGKNRVCLNILFNSGQSFTWICPWSLWILLMSIEINVTGKSTLNRWEKLLFYLEKTQTANSLNTVSKLLITLFNSVGIDLTWREIERAAGKAGRQEIQDWQWWQDWVSIRAFLTRQALKREQWQIKVGREQEAAS